MHLMGESKKGKTNSKIRGNGVQCYHYKKIGCVKKNYLHCKSKDNEDDHVGNVNIIIDYEDLFIVFEGKISYSQDWTLDYSPTLHVCSKKKYLILSK